MRQRTRKFIGIILMILLLIIYALGAMLVGVWVLPSAGPWTELLFYFVAGMGWMLPGGMLITWMQKPDPEPLMDEA